MSLLLRWLESGWLLFFYLVVLALVLLTPSVGSDGLILGIFRITGTLERVLNLLLFVPLPWLLKFYHKRPSTTSALLIGILTPAVVEVTQSQIPGRVSDPIDALLNSSGYYLALLSLKLFDRI